MNVLLQAASEDVKLGKLELLRTPRPGRRVFDEFDSPPRIRACHQGAVWEVGCLVQVRRDERGGDDHTAPAFLRPGGPISQMNSLRLISSVSPSKNVRYCQVVSKFRLRFCTLKITERCRMRAKSAADGGLPGGQGVSLESPP